MPYNLELPSGRVLTGVPDDISQTQALTALRNIPQFATDFRDQEKTGIGTSLKSGLRSTLGSQETGIRGIASFFGIQDVNEAAKEGVFRGIKTGQELEGGVSLEKVKEKFRDPDGLGIFSAVAEVGRQIPRAVAEQVPLLGQMFVTGRAGAMAGAATGNPYAAIFGGIAGGSVPAFIQLFGSNIERKAYKDLSEGKSVDVETDKAALAAVGQTALEVAPIFGIFGKRLFGNILGDKASEFFAKGSTKELEDVAKSSVYKLGAKGIAKGIVFEGSTEVGQQLIERAQAGLEILSEDALQEYAQALYGGSLVGGTLGAGAGILQKRGAGDRLQAARESEENKRLNAESLAAEEKAKAEQEQLQKTRDQLSEGQIDPETGQPMLQLGYDPTDVVVEELETIEVPSFVKSPVRSFSEEELTPLIFEELNRVRSKKEAGRLPKLKQFTIEDISDQRMFLAPEQQQIVDTKVNELLMARLREDPDFNVKPTISLEEISLAAKNKGQDVNSAGVRSLIQRITGQEVKTLEDIDALDKVKKQAVFHNISKLPVGVKLPNTTNATRFSDNKYKRSLNAVKKTLKEIPGLSPKNIVDEIQSELNTPNRADAENLLEKAINEGELAEEMRTQYVVKGVRQGRPFQIAIPARFSKNLQDRNKYASERQGQVDKTTNRIIFEPSQKESVQEDAVSEDMPQVQLERIGTGKARKFIIKRNNKRILEDRTFVNENQVQKLIENRKNKEAKTIARNEKEQENNQQKIDVLDQQIIDLEFSGKSGETDVERRRVRLLKRISDLEDSNVNLQNEIDESENANFTFEGVGKQSVGKFTLRNDAGDIAGSFPTKEAAFESGLNDTDAEGNFVYDTEYLANVRKGQYPQIYKRIAEKVLKQRTGKPGIRVRLNIPEGATSEQIQEIRKTAEENIRGVIPSPELKEKSEELRKALTPRLKKLGLENVALNITSGIDGDFESEGSFAGTTISLAMRQKDGQFIPISELMGTLNHEGIHALKKLGAFSRDEWRVLTNKAKSSWVKEYLGSVKASDKDGNPSNETLLEAYKRVYNNDMEKIEEEAIAEAFRNYADTKPPAGMIGNVFRRIGKFFEALRNALSGLGFKTSEDIFIDIDTGKKKIDTSITPDPLDVMYRIRTTSEKAKELLTEFKNILKRVNSRVNSSKDQATMKQIEKAGTRLREMGLKGIEGKNWYKKTVDQVLKEVDNNTVLAEKFIQLLAIYSPAQEVKGNLTQALKAWKQWSSGKPVTEGTGNAKKNANNLLNFGIQWAGRKTNTFYRNFMDAMNNKVTEDSTIDLHMARLIFGKDAPSPIEYELGQSLVSIVARQEDMSAPELQAAAWVAQKQHTILANYEKKGIHKTKSPEWKIDHAFKRAVIDYGTDLKDRKLPPLITEEMQEAQTLLERKVKQADQTRTAEERMVESGDALRQRVRTITAEYVPSLKVMVEIDGKSLPLYSQINELTKTQKTKLTKEIIESNILTGVLKDFGITPKNKDEVATKSRVSIETGAGSYEGNVNPNILIRVVNDNDPLQAEKDAENVSRIMSYVFRQEAVPFIRPVADLRDAPLEVPKANYGYLFNFKENIGASGGMSQDRFVKLLEEILGSQQTFTQITPNQIIIIDFENSSDVGTKEKEETQLAFASKVKELESEVSDFLFDGKANIFGYLSTYNSDKLDSEGNTDFNDNGGNYDHDNEADRQVIINGLSPTESERPNVQARLDTAHQRFIDIARESVKARQSKLSEKNRQDVRFRISPAKTTAFKRWFGDSKIVNEDGTPKIMYHGTAADITSFKPKQAKSIFVTDDPEFAENFAQMSENYMVENAERFMSQDDINQVYAEFIQTQTRFKSEKQKEKLLKELLEEDSKNGVLGVFDLFQGAAGFSFRGEDYETLQNVFRSKLPSDQNIMPLYVSAKNPFDYENPEHVKQVAIQGSTDFDISNGSWKIIEDPSTQERIKNAGFDSYYVKEGMQKNLALYKPTQLKSASGNVGTFDSDNKDIRYRFTASVEPSTEAQNQEFKRDDEINQQIKKEAGVEEDEIRYSIKKQIENNLGSEYVELMDRVTAPRVKKNYENVIVGAISPQPLNTWGGKFRASIINKHEGIERLTQRAADVLGDRELEPDVSAVGAAVMSDRAAGVAAQSFKHGIPIYDKKTGLTKVFITNKQGQKVKGLIPLLKPLMDLEKNVSAEERGTIFRAFQTYAAARRSVGLQKRNKKYQERIFTDEDIKKALRYPEVFPEFEQVFDDYQKYNQGTVNFLIDTGVITRQMGQAWNENADYIPFYRQFEGDQTSGPQILSGLGGQKIAPQIEGSEKQFKDFLSNVVQNSRAAIEAGMKNVAAVKTIDQAQRINDKTNDDYVQKVGVTESGKRDVLSIRRDGKVEYYRVADPLLMRALVSTNLVNLPFVNILAKPANLLRELVTRDPGFMAANLFRDSFAAWFVGGKKGYKPVIDSLDQVIRIAAQDSIEAQNLLRAGIGTGYEFKGDAAASSEVVLAELRKQSGIKTTSEKVFQLPSDIWNALEMGTTASDLASRAAVYKRTMEEGGGEAQAVIDALEIMNFGRRGDNPLIQILTASIPFLNARIQGLDVLYRAGFGKLAVKDSKARQKAFFVRATSLMALTTLYYMMAKDTEEYKRAEQEVKDNNWIIGGKKLPVPFELGFLFKTIPERITAYFYGQDTTEDLVASFKRGITGTLNAQPFPQAIKPIVEVTTNHSFFTGRDIVSRKFEGIEDRYQAGSGTSLLARYLGETINISPIQIDFLTRAYLGTIGSYGVMVVDEILQSQGAPLKPELNIDRLPIIKRFVADEYGTGTVTEFYEVREKIREAVKTFKHLSDTRSQDEVAQYLQENGGLLIFEGYVNDLALKLNELTKLSIRIGNAKNLSSEEKRQRQNSIKDQQYNLTKRIKNLKKNIAERRL